MIIFENETNSIRFSSFKPWDKIMIKTICLLLVSAVNLNLRAQSIVGVTDANAIIPIQSVGLPDLDIPYHAHHYHQFVLPTSNQ